MFDHSYEKTYLLAKHTKLCDQVCNHEMEEKSEI